MPDSAEAPEHFDLGGSALALRRHGTGQPAVVFISGRGDSSRVWDAVVDRLQVSATAITYDRPGCGESADLPTTVVPAPRPSSWSAGQLADLLTVAGVTGPLVLVGHSLGGQIADAFATRLPDRVAGLVLVDSVDPELNLETEPPHPVIDDAEDSRPGRGWQWDVAGSAREFRETQPSTLPPTVVVASAIWRWFRAKRPEWYRPFTLVEVDQRWQRAQLHYANRWHGALVVAHDAGHRVHEEAPVLVAAAVDAVVAATKSGTALRLDEDLLRCLGGSVRPTSGAG